MALVGSNGAGKSTTLKALMGLKRLTSGSLELDGQRIDGTSAAQRVGMGIALSPEGRRLFPRMSVWENLMVGAHTVSSSEQRNRSLELVYELFPRVKERREQMAGSLSGGEQKQLEIGRALLLRPRVLLIDEPSIGLSPIVVQDVFKLLRKLADQGTTVLMVEQNVKSALKISDDAIALESGRLVLHRPAAELLADPDIERLFLGGHAPAAPAAATV